MTDREFLEWLRDRLVFIYKESPDVDFVIRLSKIVNQMKLEEYRPEIV